MNRHDETGEITDLEDGDAPPAPGEPVGRVNLPIEPDDADAMYGVVALRENGQTGLLNTGAGQTREKVLYGLLTVVLMVLSLIVILQGVFEQKMPV